ncbi:MAG: hypothetical protein H6745_08365 [Deltaproteobacteria bacterium]|nr:hypothetical protein [Deltaproteobacteria bacterium]
MTTADAPAAVVTRRPGIVRRLLDRANPVLVRYVRQQLRSRAFIVVFSLVLAIATLCALSVAGQVSLGDTGAAPALLGLLSATWTFAVWVFEPVSVFRAVARERDDNTWDLLRLTGLSPGRFLRGIMLASVLQGLLYMAAIAPFFMMAYLLRGIDLVTVALALVLIPVAGWCASAGAIGLACLGYTKGLRTALTALVAVTCGIIWFMSLTMWLNFEHIGFAFVFFGIGEDGVFIALDFAVFWVATCLVLGAALLRHPSANRATGPRVLAFLIPLDVAVVAFASDPLASHELFGVTGIVAGLCAFVLGIFAVAEDFAVTPRQARDTARMRWFQLPVLFAPGGARGRVAFAVLSALAVVFGALSEQDDVLAVTLGLASYAAIVMALGDLVGRRLYRSTVTTPFGRRVATVIVLAVLTFLAVAGMGLGPKSPLGLLSPLPGLWLLGDRGSDYVAIVLVPGVVAWITMIAFGARQTLTRDPHAGAPGGR